jgi:hypothetical protein
VSGNDRHSSSVAAAPSDGGSSSAVWQGDLSSVLGSGRHRLRAQLDEARRELGHVGAVRQNAVPATSTAAADTSGSWMMPAAAAARDAQLQRQQQPQRTGASVSAPFAVSMYWPEGQEMSYDALLALDRSAIQKGVPKVNSGVQRVLSCAKGFVLCKGFCLVSTNRFFSVDVGSHQEEESCRFRHRSRMRCLHGQC